MESSMLSFQELLLFFLANDVTLKFGMIEDAKIEVIATDRKGRRKTYADIDAFSALEEIHREMMADEWFAKNDG
jgi:hypothetical protein